MNKYQSIVDVVKADIERVNANLDFDLQINPKLQHELSKILTASSKRIRSVMTILFLRASKLYLLPLHYELLTAVELVHNSSLIHDDVIDEGNLRRNRKTLNSKFDNNLAVISGDYLLGCVLEKLVKINSKDITQTFAMTVKEMCKGEINQYFTKGKKPQLEKYIEKSVQKTASLFVCALKSAVILAESEFDERAQEFALNFGIAFQIRDDLLAVIKKDKTKSSNDIEEGIYTAPLILSNNLEDGIEKTKVLLNNYVNCAKQAIEDLDESIYKKALYELLELLNDV